MWDECGIGLCATMLKMLGRCGIFTGPHNFYNFFSFLSDLGIWGLIYGSVICLCVCVCQIGELVLETRLATHLSSLCVRDWLDQIIRFAEYTQIGQRLVIVWDNG